MSSPLAGRRSARRSPPRARHQAAPSRRRAARVAGVRALKRAAPHAEIDALVYAETAPMLANHPAIARAPHDRPRLEAPGRCAPGRAPNGRCCATLRARRYDLLVHLTEHPRGLTLARLLRPRYAVTRERDGARAGCGGAHFTHFYRLPRATPRHTVETQPRRAAPHRHLSRTRADRARAGARRGRATRSVAALLAQHGAGGARLRAGASGLALAVQVLAGRAQWRRCSTASSSDGFADRRHRRARRARARAGRRDDRRRAPRDARARSSISRAR